MNAGPRAGVPVVADPLAFCAEEVARLEAEGLGRRVRALESASEPEVMLDGRRVLCLASNNYLGLAAHPEVVDAAAEAARHYGAGSGSARLVTGGLALHDELEARLAAFKGTEAALRLDHRRVPAVPGRRPRLPPRRRRPPGRPARGVASAGRRRPGAGGDRLSLLDGRGRRSPPRHRRRL
jgi:hypothetical protein